MTDWIRTLAENLERDEESVLITIAGTKGSTPRETGAKMIVGESDVSGSIGGGNLEYKSIEIARCMLHDSSGKQTQGFFKSFTLGPQLGQCCGGHVVLLFEKIDSAAKLWVDELFRQKDSLEASILITLTRNELFQKILVTDNSVYAEKFEIVYEAGLISQTRKILNDHSAEFFGLKNFPAKPDDTIYFREKIVKQNFPVMLFGAGHIGKALVRVLADTPCRIFWIDSRLDAFPEHLPDNVKTVSDEQPECEVDFALTGAYYIVMTHSHQLDSRICERILKRGDHAWCGLIGSRSKRRKFEKRFRQAGISESAITSLNCPIGIDGITGKQPEVIAISVAAQLLELREAVLGARHKVDPLVQSFR